MTAATETCIICQQPNTEEYAFAFAGGHAHARCYYALRAKAPLRRITGSTWHPVRWDTAKLDYVLECGHEYPAERENQQRIRCRACLERDHERRAGERAS